MCQLATMYYSGARGVEKDWTLAHQLFTCAAQLGHARAQFNVGVAYLYGNGVGQSSRKGTFELLRISFFEHNKWDTIFLSTIFWKQCDSFFFIFRTTTFFFRPLIFLLKR